MTDELSGTAPGEALLSAPLFPTGDVAPARTFFGAAVPEGYSAMVDEIRGLLDRVAAAAPSAKAVAEVRRTIAGLDDLLADAVVEESDQIAGRLHTVPGRGQLAVPPYAVDEVGDDHARGRVRFGRHFLGSNGSVHGGVVPLLFDDLFGRLAFAGGRSRARTAFLHVDYRSVAPVGRDLLVDAHLEREEGRKRFLRGRLSDGARVCAEASALFVAVRPGQT